MFRLLISRSADGKTDLIANFQRGNHQSRAYLLLIATELLAYQVFDGVDWTAEALAGYLKAGALGQEGAIQCDAYEVLELMSMSRSHHTYRQSGEGLTAWE
jgi:hypothetical protein